MSAVLNTTSVRTSEEANTLRLVIAIVCICLGAMMLIGWSMRASQATHLAIDIALFYQLMTLHGAGMVAVAGLGGAMVMWTFLRSYVCVSLGAFRVMVALTLGGVVLAAAAILLGRFAAGWTFLYPLPAKSYGVWAPGSAATFVVGLTLIGVAFLIFYADCAMAIMRRYGSLWNALGIPQLISGRTEQAPAPAVIASSMVIIVNVLGILAGAVVLSMTLVNLAWPTVSFDALLMKNLIYFFGHVFINASIYMAVVAIYEILPTFTGRPWKASRVFIASWVAAIFLVTSVYPHHLLMDSVMPAWMSAMGQVASYYSGIPVIAVTAWGVLTNLHRSGIRWNLCSALLVLGAAGWAMGVIPAVVDGTIVVNRVMHNTLWVPGHFHMYLLLGLTPILLGFMLHFAEPNKRLSRGEWYGFWLYAIGGWMFCASFLYAGVEGVPRRFAVHEPHWLIFSKAGAFAAALVFAVVFWLLARIVIGVGKGRALAAE